MIRSFKSRVKVASSNSDDVNKTLLHVDRLVSEWADIVARCNEEEVNLRYNPTDKSADALLVPYEDEARVRGLWKTLSSMRNVEKTGLFKIVEGVKK